MSTHTDNDLLDEVRFLRKHVNLTRVLRDACVEGDLPTAKMVIKYGGYSKLPLGIGDAILYGRTELVDYFLDHYRFSAKDINMFMRMAARAGNLVLLKKLQTKGANNFGTALHEAILYCRLDIIRYIYEDLEVTSFSYPIQTSPKILALSKNTGSTKTFDSPTSKDIAKVRQYFAHK